jgi:hypothetical protein
MLRAIARSVQHASQANRGPPAGFDGRAVGLANAERFHHPVLRVPAARLASTAVEGEADPASKEPAAAEQPDSGAGDAGDASDERPQVRVIVTKKKVHPTDNAAVTKSLQELGAGAFTLPHSLPHALLSDASFTQILPTQAAGTRRWLTCSSGGGQARSTRRTVRAATAVLVTWGRAG